MYLNQYWKDERLAFSSEENKVERNNWGCSFRETTDAVVLNPSISPFTLLNTHPPFISTSPFPHFLTWIPMHTSIFKETNEAVVLDKQLKP